MLFQVSLSGCSEEDEEGEEGCARTASKHKSTAASVPSVEVGAEAEEAEGVEEREERAWGRETSPRKVRWVRRGSLEEVRVSWSKFGAAEEEDGER